MKLAPIVLFVYNRPKHTEQTLEALGANELAKDSILYVFCDGPKIDATSETLQKIATVRKIVEERKWCKEVILIQRETNLGLASSIVAGVSQIVNEYGKVIVLEDDILTSRYFLYFMNANLDLYAADKRVYAIGACNFYGIKNRRNSFFLQIPDTWGWATWKDRWEKFEPSARKLQERLENNVQAKYIFNCYNSFDYSGMLNNQIEGKIDSWGIRWQAAVALNNGLVLYPSPSLTNHLKSANNEATHQLEEVSPKLMNRIPKITRIALEVKKSSKKQVIITLSGTKSGIGIYAREIKQLAGGVFNFLKQHGFIKSKKVV